MAERQDGQAGLIDSVAPGRAPDRWLLYGYHWDGLISLSYPGTEGAARMAEITAELRAESLAEIAGLAVEGVVDYFGGWTREAAISR